MIIKSKTRKAPSFRQLIRYCESRMDEEFSLSHNLFWNHLGWVATEFEENAKLLPKRSNGVYLYQEIISITRTPWVPLQRQKEALKEIVEHYIDQRCPFNQVYGVLHDDRADNLHYHLILSANALGATKRLRMSRWDFNSLQRNMETWVLRNYPELKQSKLRSIVQEAKAFIQATALPIFNDSYSPSTLHTKFAEVGMKLYTRGKSIGITYQWKNHRLKTLGLSGAFQSLSDRVEGMLLIEQSRRANRGRRRARGRSRFIT